MNGPIVIVNVFSYGAHVLILTSSGLLDLQRRLTSATAGERPA
ncbi:MAG TPA: hypothetical protein VFQ44_03845 [Streptosporangiaceae bacterium]|nr:hypothetical protein [Streptosporangiaceae bacterium]